MGLILDGNDTSTTIHTLVDENLCHSEAGPYGQYCQWTVARQGLDTKTSVTREAVTNLHWEVPALETFLLSPIIIVQESNN